MAELLVPAGLVALFPGMPRRMTVGGTSVREIVDELEAERPGIADRIRIPGGDLRPNLRVFVDREPASLATPVGPASVVQLLLATAGG